MPALIHDLRFSLRQMRNARIFSLTVIVVLALGIGANTAVFTLVHAVMLKSLPVAKPEQLFRVGDQELCCVNGGLQGSWSLFPYDLYKHFREQTPAFEQLAAFQAGREPFGLRRMTGNRPADSVAGEFVSGNYFQMFGINAYAGRLFTADDDRPGGPPVAVLSYRAWREKYGADATLPGSAVAIDGQPFTLVGISPPGFFGDGLRSDPPEIWIPLSFEPLVHGTNSLLTHSDQSWLNMMGRVPSTAQPKQVEAQMTTELRQWLESQLDVDMDRKEIPQQVVRLTPGGAGVQVMRENYQNGLKVLLWVTGFVLLIACANLANLMLARTAARRQEMSVRSALGASQARLVRHAFSETLLLSLIGGAAGIFVASSATRFILRLTFPNRYVPIDPTPSWSVLAFAFVLSILTAFLFGMLPVWLIARTQPIDALRAANRATETQRHWMQRSLVIVQAALSLVLICGAGLVVQSLRHLRNQHFGFETQGRYIVEFDPQMAGYKTEQLDALYRQIREGVRQIPGVASVSYAMYTPMSNNNWEGRVNVEERPADAEDYAVWVRVGPDYFSSIGTRVLQGRPITEQDTATSRPVAVVNAEFVKKYFDGKNALGRHLGKGGTKHVHDFEIVGVTENTNYWAPGMDMRPMFFVAAPQQVKYETAEGVVTQQRSMYMGNIVLHVSGPTADLEKQVRRVLASINPDLPVTEIHSFERQVQSNLDQQQMVAQLMTMFGLLALLLASVGLYGVTSYAVERRTNEIGVRMALGADRFSVVRMVMRSVALQSTLGLLIGLPLVFAAGQMLANRFFGVTRFDLAVLAIAAAALGASAVIAGFLPARRAASIEPMQALRTE